MATAPGEITLRLDLKDLLSQLKQIPALVQKAAKDIQSDSNVRVNVDIDEGYKTDAAEAADFIQKAFQSGVDDAFVVKPDAFKGVGKAAGAAGADAGKALGDGWEVGVRRADGALFKLGDDGRWRDMKGRIVSTAKAMGDTFEQEGARASKAMTLNTGAINFASMVTSVREVSAAVSEMAQPLIALDKVTAQIRTLGPEGKAMANDLRAAALTMAKDLPIAASDIAQSMFDALASGVQGGVEGIKTFTDVSAKLAVGGGSSIAEATALMAGQLNAYGATADQAGKFSDVFFNTVNFGVTSISELSSQLSNVVPTAAGAGIEIENVGAALAVMTQKGVPTAQSTTKLNQLLIELQKPAAGLAPILREAGVSLESLKQDDLPATLAKVKVAMDATGKSAVQVFGSSEAAAAFQTLTGDLGLLQETFVNVRDTAGSTDNAYNEMAQSIQVQSDLTLNRVKTFVTEGLDKLGPSILSGVQSASQLAPTLTALTGLGQIIPDGAKEKAGAFFGEMLKGGISMKSLTGSVSSVGTSLKGLATGGFGPLLIGAAIFTLLYQKSESFRTVVDKLFGILSKTLGSIFKAVEPLITGVLGALTPIIELLGDLVAAILLPLLPLLDAILAPLAPILKVVASLIVLLLEPIKLVMGALGGLLSAVSTIIGGIGGLIGGLFSGGGFEEMKNGALALGAEAGEAFMNGYKSRLDKDELDEAMSDLKEAQEENLANVGNKQSLDNLDELVDRYNKTADEIEKKRISEVLGENLPNAAKDVKFVRDELGQLQRQYTINTEAAKEYIKEQREGLGENAQELQGEFINGLRAQAQAYDENKKKVTELSDEIAKQSLIGGDTSALQGQLDEAKKAAEQAKKDITDTMKQADVGGVFKDLTPEAQKEMEKLRASFGPVMKEIETDIAGAKIGAALGEAASLKEDLDKSGKIQDLVNKFNNAKTEVEKNSLASAIAAEAPNAIEGMKQITDANGQIQTVYQISGAKALEFAEANRTAVGKDISAQQEVFKENLGQMADQFNDTKNRAGELADKIVEGTKQGKDVGSLRKQYSELMIQLDATGKNIATNVEQGKKFGLIKGDVKAVGTEFGYSSQRAQAVTESVGRISDGLQQASSDAADLGAEFAAAQAEAASAATKYVNEAAALVIQLRDNTLSELDRKAKQDRLAEVRKLAKDARTEERNLNGVLEAEDAAAGKKQFEKRKERRRVEARRFIELEGELARERIRGQRENAKIEDDTLRELANAELDYRLKQKEQEIAVKNLNEQIRVANANGERAQAAELGRQLADLRKTQAEELKTIEEDKNKILKAAQENFGTDYLDNVDELHTLELDRQRQLLDKKKIADLKSKEGTAARLEEETKLINEQARQQQLALVTGSEDFEKAMAERTAAEIKAVIDAQLAVAQARQDRAEAEQQRADALAKGDTAGVTAADALISAAESRITAAQPQLAAAEQALFTKLGAERQSYLDKLLAIPADEVAGLAPELQVALAELRKITEDGAEKISSISEAIEKRNKEIDLKGARDAIIASSKDLRDQERRLALFDLDERLRQELEGFEGNEERKVDAMRRAARERQEIERKYLNDTDFAYRLSYTIRDAIRRAFADKLEDGDKKDLEHQKEKLKDEERLLQESLERRDISYSEFVERQQDLAQQLSDVEKQLTTDRSDFDLAVKRAGIFAAEAFEARRIEVAEEAHNNYASLQDRKFELEKKGTEKSLDEIKELAQIESDIISSRTKNYTAFIGVALGQFARLVAEGKNMGKAFLQTMIDVALVFLTKMIPVWIAAAYGTEVSKLGLVGLGTATIAVGVITGLATIAKSALKLKDGAVRVGRGDTVSAPTVRLKGPGTRTSDSIPAFLSLDETIINAQSSIDPDNEELFHWVNANPGKSWRAFLAAQVKNLLPKIKLPDFNTIGTQVYDALAPQIEESLILKISKMPIPLPALIDQKLIAAAIAQQANSDRSMEVNAELAKQMQRVADVDEKRMREEKRMNKKQGKHTTTITIGEREIARAVENYRRRSNGRRM